ncbi:MAG: NAD(P)H-binding protein [Parachlamydiales bacterium]|jgi:nucleoside-diphosphate-sugar epimerase
MKIAIFGCSYISSELAKDLTSKDHFVTCISRNPDSIKNFSASAQKLVVMKGEDENEMSCILEENDIIIVSFEEGNDLDNLKTAQMLKRCAINMNSAKRLIYTSRTTIYGDHQGMWVDESCSLNAKDEESKILIEKENTLYSLTDYGWKVTILRLSKIYGPERTIVDLFKMIYKNVMSGHGEYFTNMVHLQDVIGVINYVIEHEILGIYNVVDDDHPTRQEFANQVCTKINYLRPKFDPNIADLPDNNKRISNYRIKEKGYIFKHPHREL